MTSTAAASGRKSVPEANGIRLHQITMINDALDKMKPKVAPIPNISNRDAVLKVREKVLKAREKGYTWGEVHDVIKNNGINITLATMQSYLQPGRVRRTADRSANRSDTTATAPAQVAAAPEPSAEARTPSRRITTRGRSKTAKQAAKARKTGAAVGASQQA